MSGPTMKSLQNDLGEDIRTLRVGDAMNVHINRKKGFTRSFAAITANIGSVDFGYSEDGNWTPLPDGIAHFLEHKLFEDEEGDVSDRFARLGASTNAHTGFTSTSYLFSCTSDFERNLELLLDFVQTPYFDPQSVERERGIIAQEIRMYDDDPDWRVYFNLLESLYHKHPVRIDIAGTVESIQAITADVLESCYRRFYHPHNLVLAVAGDVDPEQVASIVESHVRVPEENGRKRLIRDVGTDEPHTVLKDRVEQRMSVARPKLCLGYKDAPAPPLGEELNRRELSLQFGMEMIFGASSPHYSSLYEEGLIDETFGATYTAEESFGFSTIQGNTDDPEELESRLRAILKKVNEKGWDEETFERHRRKSLGRGIRSFDSVEATSYGLIGSDLRGVSPFHAHDWMKQTSREEVLQDVRNHFADERSSVSVILPQS